jgi:hypothetical protein
MRSRTVLVALWAACLVLPAIFSYIYITGEPSLEFKEFVVNDGVEHQGYHMPSVLHFWLGLTSVFVIVGAAFTVAHFAGQLNGRRPNG